MSYRLDADFRRIDALPRRPRPSQRFMEGKAGTFSHMLRRKGTDSKLWGIQGWALSEILANRGAVISLQTSAGKTLISFLAAEMLNADRPLLVIPACASRETSKTKLPAALEDWNFTPPTIKTHEWFSNAKNAGALAEINPDCIVIDEAHMLSRPSVRLTAFKNYIRKHQPYVVVMSATLLDNGVRASAHLLEWALRDRSPYPITWRGMDNLARAVDVAGDPRKKQGLGDLRKLGDHKKWLRERFEETPGVVTMDDAATQWKGTAEFTVNHAMPRVKSETARLISKIQEDWTDPDGYAVVDHLHMYRIMRQMSLGFFYRMESEPPKEWSRARKAWRGYVSEITRRSSRYSTESRVRPLAIRELAAEWIEWSEVKDNFDPAPVTVWVDRGPCEAIADWLRPGKGIAWIEHNCIGKEVERISGFPYNPNLDAVEKGSPVCLSVRGRGTALNLHDWSRNLLPSMPGKASVLDQLIGRTCRAKQKSKTVTFEAWASTEALADSFKKARKGSLNVEEMSGMSKKLNKANIRRK